MRGANDNNKRMVLKFFIRLQRVDLVYLQETKIQKVLVGLVQGLGKDKFLKWGELKAKGAICKVLVFWDK